jgi:hypothetical protein
MCVLGREMRTVGEKSMYVGCRYAAEDKKNSSRQEAGKGKKGSGWMGTVLISMPNIYTYKLSLVVQCL